MDAFYASVEQRDRPELRGKPVVVGGDWGRGVVTAASYEARQYGIHSAMPGKKAAQLCPHANFVRSRIEHYADIGHSVREIFRRFTPVIQPLSLDEAFLDVRGVIRLHGSPETIGQQIRETIRKELDLPASVGIAPLKFVAKIASDIDKPNGFKVVPEGGVLDFLDPLPISRLWGVGKVGQEKLTKSGYRFVRDLRVADIKTLNARYGAWGEHLWRLANGIDPREVVTDHLAKGIGHERTFDSDLTDGEVLVAVVSSLTEWVARRLRSARRLAGTVTLKYRTADFRTFSKTQTLAQKTDATSQFLETAITLLKQMREAHPSRVRLLGVTLGKLSAVDAPGQLSLFDQESGDAAKREVDRVSDEVTAKIGKSGLYRATSHPWIERKRKR